MTTEDLRTKELREVIEFLLNFDSYSEYQDNLTIVLDTLESVMVRFDSLKDSFDILTNRYCDLIDKS